MEFFKSIVSLLGVLRRPRPRPIALESSALSRLPRELILHITRFLLPDAAASFALCCRPIYFTVGTQCFKALEENEHLDRYKFLTLLERELPGHIACYYCKKLHAISKAHRHHFPDGYYSGAACFLPCLTADTELLTSLFIHYNFTFTIFQMAMKLHRQGLDCSKLLSLLSYKTETYFQHGCVEQCTAVAQIVAGSLFIREQRIFMISLTQPVLLPWNPIFIICPHCQFKSVESFNRYWKTIQIGSWNEPKDYINQGIIPCKYCLTEFRIDFKSYGERGNAMFVTRWLELGEGRSPLDRKWQSHVGGRKGRDWLPVEFDRGSICATFEQKEHFRFEFDSLLTPENEKELFKESPYPQPENM